MAQAGMKYIILQSVVDFTYDKDQAQQLDPDSYTLMSEFSLYPSNIAALKGINNGIDSLKECFEACKKAGIQALIAPVSDSRWFKYGWGNPQMPDGATDRATQSYMAKWTVENATISNEIASEIISKYGKDYGNQIYGWYYNNEIWNMGSACAGTDDGVYAKILSNSMNLSLNHYTQITPNKPMVLSPFVNPTLSTEEQCGEMWTDIFKLTQFRQGDVFAPQDSYGNNNSLNLDKWFSAYKKAVDTKPGLVFWANNENFRNGANVASINDFITKQVNVTAKYTSANICFSYNHYFSPLLQNVGYNAAYIDYIHNGKLDSTAPIKPVLTVNGTKVVLSSSDNVGGNAGIYSIKIYKDSTTNLYRTITCRKDNDDALFKSFWLSNSGTYYISTCDFCGNESQMASVTIE